MPEMNVALIGCRFMGKAHSNAWTQVRHFFDTGIAPVLKVACDIHAEPLEQLRPRWGWREAESDWREVVRRPDIHIVDIAVPTHLHHEIAVEAARAGKHIFCEKPPALNYAQARQMYEAARAAGVVHYLNHNYRRCPAVSLARQFIEEGKLGRIYHWRSAYLQSWIMDPSFPLTWQLRQETAGSGPHADLNSHLVDLARFLVGEIASVTAMTANFIVERPLPDDASSGAFQAGRKTGGKGKVTVEDAAFVLAEFQNGALGSFETSRFAAGRKNYNCFEIYGERGALAFNLERMNELGYFSAEDQAHAQGFRTILVTEESHPYVSRWWPPGHILGWEESHIHQVADFLMAIEQDKPCNPDFSVGVQNQAVLEALSQSAASGQWVKVAV